MFTKLFPQNENTLDRAIRIIVGLALLSIAYVGPRTPWGFVGLVPLLTGIVGSCPLYRLLGISTRTLETRTPQHGH